MQKRDLISYGIIFLILAIEYFVLRARSRTQCDAKCATTKQGFSAAISQTCPIKMPPQVCTRHNFRVANKPVYEYDQYVAAKLDELTERQAPGNDPELIELIKEMMDLPAEGGRLRLAHAPRASPQTKYIWEYFNKKPNGRFIECGAYDGEVASNTVALERYTNWTGLLIEADTNYYTQLMGKRRKVHSINGCLSPNKHFSRMTFQESGKYFGGQYGKLVDESQPGRPVPCYPLESLLLALGWTEVDYFSLDVQGMELDILKSVPWSTVNIKVVSVEFSAGKASKDDYISFMKEQGYTLKKELHSVDDKLNCYVDDLIFAKE